LAGPKLYGKLGVRGTAVFVMTDKIQQSYVFLFHKEYPITLVIYFKYKQYKIYTTP
jgi:hypothetical protein